MFASRDPVEKRLETFPKYVRRQDLKRFLALYELFKIALTVKGSIVECGVEVHDDRRTKVRPIRDAIAITREFAQIRAAFRRHEYDLSREA